MARATPIAHVEGLDELIRDAKRYDGEVSKELRKELRQVAEPVRVEIRAELAAKSSSAGSRSGVRIRLRRGTEVTIEQARSKTTGTRGDWGTIQQTRFFDPALEAKTPEVHRKLDEFADGIASKFNRGASHP